MPEAAFWQADNIVPADEWWKQDKSAPPPAAAPDHAEEADFYSADTIAPKEGASVAQMADATRATIGVVGRAVAASDLARAGMSADTLPSPPEAVATDEFGRPLDPRGRNPAQLNPAWEGVKLSSITGGEMLMRPLIEIPRIDLGRLGPSQGNVSTGTKVAVGAYNAVAGLAEFPESLLGVSTLAAGGFPAIVQRLVAGGYAIDMARHTPEQVVALARAVEGGDAQEISQTATSFGINVALVGLTAKHALAKVAPLTAEAVAKANPEPTPELKPGDILPQPPTTTPLTEQAVAKVVEKEPVPETPTPAPAAVADASGTTPVTAGEPPAKQSVTPEVTIAKPEGERALTTGPEINSRLAADVPIAEPYSDKFSVSLQITTTNPSGISDASVITSLPESLRGSVDSVQRFEGEAVPTNKAASIPGRVQIVFKDKASAQSAVDYFRAPVSPIAKVQTEVSKVASEEGQRSAKDIKDELIDEIQQKLTKAPSEAAAGDTVTIDIPGDGKFTVPNTVEALSGMLARAKKIKTDAGKIPGVPRASIKSSANAIAATTSVPKWTPDTLEPESRGPGAAASGEPGTYDPASQLTDALKTINELDPAKRAAESTRIADIWAAGKSTLEKAWGKIVAAKESLKSNLLTLPEVTPLKKLVGVIDSQLQSSSARSEALGKAFEAAHPNKIRRGAMGILVDSGMDVERVKAAIAELPEKTPRRIRQAFEVAESLTPKEMDAAQRIKTYFDQRVKDAQESGVLKNFLEDYYTHVWKNTDKMPTELRGAMNSGQVVSYFENARQRKLESFIEGVKLGLEPVLDPSLVLPRYNYNLDRAIASRAFIKKLTGIKESDGRPTAAPTGSASKIENEAGGTDATLIKPSTKSEETGDYKTVDNPALKGWKWVEKDADGNPIMVQGDLAIHPAALERIRNMMDKARLTPTAPVRIAIAAGAEVKGAKLGILSPFHQIHVGSHALWHLVNPFNLKAEIDWTLPSTKFATESGVKLAGDFHDQIGFSEGIGPGLIAQKLVPYARAYSEYLFKSFIPRLKLKTFEAVYQRDLKRYAGKATPDQIAARAADAVNSAYGELNRKWLGKDGRDPRLQRALQVSLLAPDFLEARARFVGKAFTKFGGEERMALFVMGATLYTTARVLNQLLDGDPHAGELNMMFSVRHNGRNYSVRSVLGDTAHLFSDWRSFVAHRINPFTTRTAVEAISGRELRTGLKRDTQEQVEDLLRQITPAQMDSMLPGDRAWYEGLTQSLGVTSQHQPTSSEIKKREAKAAKDAKNPPAFEFIYNPAHVKKGGAKK